MTKLNKEETEQTEKEYLDKFYHFLMFSKDKLFEGFESGNEIRRYWRQKWSAKGSFDKGAERIVYSFFNTQGFGTHNSAPVGSDLFFQTDNAFIHIDLKTVSTSTIDDANTNHDIGINQTSYPGPYRLLNKPYKEKKFKPSLPFSYNVKDIPKPCLTYFIVIIYEKRNFDVICMYITSMPNGCLRGQYKGKILKQGRSSIGKYSKKNTTRFNWEKCQEFELLAEPVVGFKPKRIRVIHYDDKHNSNYKDKLKLLKHLYDEQNYNI